jgi:phospholipase C
MTYDALSTSTTLAGAAKRKANLTPIEHVIVLMLENRSFDHMLGFLKKTNPEINGCLPNEDGCSNPNDPASENPSYYTVDDTAVYVQASPDHSIAGTTQEIYGSSDDTGPATMQGFIKLYEGRAPSGQESSVMKCFAPEHVPGKFSSLFLSLPSFIFSLFFRFSHH